MSNISIPEIINFTRLEHCPKEQLRRKHEHSFTTVAGEHIPESDGGYDLAAAHDIIIMPFDPESLPVVGEEYFTYNEQGQLIKADPSYGKWGMGVRYTRYEYKQQQIGTGICVQPERLRFFDIRPRSGFSSKYGLGIVNSPALIDASFTGEIKILAYSLTGLPIPIMRGEFIAQLVPQYQIHTVLKEVDELRLETVRGDNGFDSTGH